jgi:hypothetical protein
LPRGGFPLPDFGAWATDHVGVIVAAIVALMLIGLVLLVVSFVAQGGLVSATAELADGRRGSLGSAVHTGLHLFWRYAGLWFLLATVVIFIGMAIAAFVALVAVFLAATENAEVVIAPATLIGLLLIVAGLVAGVVTSVVVPFAQRAIAVLDVGPLAALREGWRVLRAHPGSSLLVWLLNVVLAFMVGLAITTIMVFVAVALATPLIALWLAVEINTPMALTVVITYVAVALIMAFGVLLTLISVANTFFWSYWTLAYLRLRPEARGDADT